MIQTHAIGDNTGRIGKIDFSYMSTQFDFSQSKGMNRGIKLCSQLVIHPFQLRSSKIQGIAHHGSQPYQIVRATQALFFPMLIEQQDQFQDATRRIDGQQDIAFSSQHTHDGFHESLVGLTGRGSRQDGSE